MAAVALLPLVAAPLPLLVLAVVMVGLATVLLVVSAAPPRLVPLVMAGLVAPLLLSTGLGLVEVDVAVEPASAVVCSMF